MYATSGVSSILRVRPEHLLNKSFYFCIAEGCLQDAVRCLESAKSNDSIAYLRFWFRNPLLEERNRAGSRDAVHSSDDDEDEGGIRLQRHDQAPAYADEAMDTNRSRSYTGETDASNSQDIHNSKSTSGNSTDVSGNADDAIFDSPTTTRSSSSSLTPVEDMPIYTEPMEIEAVVSCTSDGLVVILRRARPSVTQLFGSQAPVDLGHSLFASPWAMFLQARPGLRP